MTGYHSPLLLRHPWSLEKTRYNPNFSTLAGQNLSHASGELLMILVTSRFYVTTLEHALPDGRGLGRALLFGRGNG